jgi:acyl-CoA reductase-like NAD-dependent aldehyde dehydrogenase
MSMPSSPISSAASLRAAQSGQDIGQAIRDAAEQVRDAAQQAREAQQQVREAQQHVREAQQQVREAQQQVRQAHTADQRSAANQSLNDAQQAVVEAQAAAQAAEALTKSGQQVYTSMPPIDMRNVIPPQAVDLAFGFFITCAVIIVGWPISRAFARRMDRRGAGPALDSGLAEQLQRIEQSVDAISIEVERISESQRFMARLQERSASSLQQ